MRRIYIKSLIGNTFRKLKVYLKGLLNLCFCHYKAIGNLDKISPKRSLQATVFSLNNQTLIHNADFLPDRLSFSGKLFERSPHYSFAKEYINNPQFDYKDTEYYRLAEKGHLSFPCKGKKQAELRCREFIYIINSIIKIGYQPETDNHIAMIECVDDKICLFDGKHRLAALFALGIKEFPVVFCYDNEVRLYLEDHIKGLWPTVFYKKSFQLLHNLGKPIPEKKLEINSLIEKIKKAKLETWADIYHPVPFYEFRNLTTQVTNQTPYKRLNMILSRYNDLKSKQILDMGCNVGFYSFSLAKRGAIVTGIDSRPEYIEIAYELSKIYDIPVKFINKPVTTEFFEVNDKRYDIILCFSMLQWVIDQKGIDYGLKILKTISDRSQALFFDTSVNIGKSCLKSKEGEELAYVYNLLYNNTSYKHIKHIGNVHPYGVDTRHIFFCHH